MDKVRENEHFDESDDSEIQSDPNVNLELGDHAAAISIDQQDHVITKLNQQVSYLKLLRSYDGILYSILIFVFLNIHPEIFGDNKFYLIYRAVPLFAICWFCFFIPTYMPEFKHWNNTIIYLRIAAIVAALTSPLAMNWFNFKDNAYYMTNFIICMYSFFFCIFLISKLSEILGENLEVESLAWEAKASGFICFWGGIITFMGGLVLYILFKYSKGDVFSILEISEMQTHVSLVIPFLLIILISSLFFISQMIRTRIILYKILNSELQEND